MKKFHNLRSKLIDDIKSSRNSKIDVNNEEEEENNDDIDSKTEISDV
jgi:hypothetical protein